MSNGLKHCRQILSLGIVVIVLALAMLPLVPAEGYAAENEEEKPTLQVGKTKSGKSLLVDELVTPTAEVFVEPAEEATEEPREEPTETDEDAEDEEVPAPDEVDEPDLDVIDVGFAWVDIDKRGCPLGFDAYAADVYDLAYNCHEEQSGVYFGVSDGAQEIAGQATNDVVVSGVEFTGLPAGAYSIYEQVPAGYGAPRVFCILGTPENGAGPTIEQQVLDGNQIFAILGADEALSCSWYNIPATDQGGEGYVTIQKYGCAPAVDAEQADLETLRQDCKPTKPVTFTLTNSSPSGDPYVESVETDADGLAMWFVPNPGSVTIEEQLPEGFSDKPVVFCGTIERTGDGPSSLGKVDATGAAIAFDLKPGEQVYCDWFNRSKRPKIKVDADSGTISIHKHLCQPDFNAYNAGPLVLAAYCEEALQGVVFEVTDFGNFSESKETAGTTESLAVFTGLDAGEYSVTEQIPAGFGTPIVYCDLTLPGEEDSLTAMQVEGGNAIFALVLEGQRVACDWYNVPGESDQPAGDVTIQVTKYTCPLGYDAYNADHPGLALNCQGLFNGVSFGVSDGDAYVAQQVTGDVQDSGVVFDGLAEGAYSIVETVPDGYGEPVVYCDSYALDGSSPDGSYEAAVLDGNQILEVVKSGLFFCDWYNVPVDDPGDEPGDVVIAKHVCPAGYDATSADVYDLAYNCGDPLTGITFLVSDGATAIAQQTTGADGVVQFDQLPFAPLSFVEQVPDGFGEPVVYCTSYSLDANGPVVVGPTKMTVDAGSQFFYILKDGETLVCDWYNVPDGDENGSITIVKFVCAAGYDLYAQGANPDFDCKDEANGIAFTLDGPSDEGVTAETGTSGSGKLTWGGLKPGSYTVTEQVPYGTDYVFVLSCEGSSKPEIQGYPLSVGAELAIELYAGDHLICYWYNVADQPDRGTIVVFKYVCPTASFIDADDCERYEGGASFELGVLNGNGWDEVDQDTTDGNGMLTWAGLQPGTYEIDEVGGTWCYATADRTDEDGNLVVVSGEETTVWVYNCGQKVVTKKPTKFPNTGTGQVAGAVALATEV